MSRSIIIVCALAILSLSVALAQEDVAFSKFQDYMKKHNKLYQNIEELLVRYDNFKASLTRIAERNDQQPGENVFGLTKFSDMSVDEFKARSLGFKPSKKHMDHIKVKKPVTTAVPTSFDWRTHGAVTAVKDQGQCGSCWAFSAAEEIESMWHLLGNNTLTKFSPQQITSCDTVDGGCNGGDTPSAYQYVMKAGGIEADSVYPYTSGSSGSTGTCKFNKAKVVADISGFSYATTPCYDSCKKQDENTLASNLATTGPVSICVYAESWMDYSSGVLKSNCPAAYSSLDHCVQLVGYNKSGSTPYWIVRNSWNTDWGVDGYIYIASGSNLCGVADEATFVELKK